MNISEIFPQFFIGEGYDTYNNREELKARGFRWDAQKKGWWHKDKAERDDAEMWLPVKEHDDWGAAREWWGDGDCDGEYWK